MSEQISYSWSCGTGHSWCWHWHCCRISRLLGSPRRPCSHSQAALTHVYIENPIRFQPWLVARRGATLALGACSRWCPSARRCSPCSWLEAWRAIRRIAAIEGATRDIYGMSREGCVSLMDSAAVRTCEFGDPDSATRIVLFGDSHAIQWFDALERIANERHWQLVTLLIPPRARQRTWGSRRSPVRRVARGGHRKSGLCTRRSWSSPAPRTT